MPKPLPGRSIQTQTLRALHSAGLYTDDSLAAYLSVVWDRPIDRSLITRWRSGERAMPVDALLHIADHTEDPVRSLATIAHACQCAVSPMADGASDGKALQTHALRLGQAVGKLQAAIADSLDPDIDGDEGDEQSAESLLEAVEALGDEVASMRQDLRRLNDRPALRRVR
jgi:hypothetical protein